MSQSHTPPKARVSGQLSGGGTISSEDRLFRDEMTDREFYIPFGPFAHAFLQPKPDDAGFASVHRNSLEFRAAYDLFSQSLFDSQNESSQIYSSLAALINNTLRWEIARQPAPSALPLRFEYLSSSAGIQGDWNSRKPDMVGVHATAPTVSWMATSVACEYKYESPPLYRQDAKISAKALAQSKPSENTSRSRSQASSLSVPPSSSAKRRPSKPPVERDLQLARYLLEMRSHQETRDAVFGIFFMKDHASFWYADSDSTIKSLYVPIDSTKFITALMCLARADAALLGYSPRFLANGRVVTSSAVEDAQFCYSSDINTPNADAYPLHDVISVARALHGRCSRVLGSTVSGNQDCVLKLSHQVLTRINEAELIDRAHQRKIDGVIRVIFSVDLEKLSDGPRSRLQPGLIPGSRQDLLVEDRVLRLLVLPRCMPLYRVVNPRHFLMASISLLKTICSLYEQGKIMHRDISVNNLMVRVDKPWVGVLIDLDLAIDLRIKAQLSPSSLHRTGTLPFMALDLLHDDDTYPQYHRHDLESFVYVLTWIAGRYENGLEVDKLLFNRWCEGDWTTIADNKLAFLAFSSHYAQFAPNLSYAFLQTPIRRYRKLLRDAHLTARDDLQAQIDEQRVNTDVQGKKRQEHRDEGYVDSSSGSKRKRLSKSVQTERVQVPIYPKDLHGLSRDSLLLGLEDMLLALGPAPPDAFTGRGR